MTPEVRVSRAAVKLSAGFGGIAAELNQLTKELQRSPNFVVGRTTTREVADKTDGLASSFENIAIALRGGL
jgi:hypothetical protein